MVALKRLQQTGTIPESEVKRKGKERAVEPRATVSEIQRPGGESTKRKGKEEAVEPRVIVSEIQRAGGESSKGKGKARVTFSETEEGEASKSPTTGDEALARQAQRETEDQERAARRRLRMFSDGHPDRCTCPLCPTNTLVQESLRDGVKEGEASTGPTVEDGLKEGELSRSAVEDMDLDALKPTTNRTVGAPGLGRKHQWSVEDRKRAGRWRLNALSDGHPPGCKCEACGGNMLVQQSLWNEWD